MAFPKPEPGLVIRYSYLWRREFERGQEEGAKDRPCAIVLATRNDEDDQIVTVLPFTHSPPTDPALAVELPAAVKQRLGLDHERSWVMLNEANRFYWPGPDLRPSERGNAASVACGTLPYKLFEDIRLKFLAAVKAKKAKATPRSE